MSSCTTEEVNPLLYTRLHIELCNECCALKYNEKKRMQSQQDNVQEQTKTGNKTYLVPGLQPVAPVVQLVTSKRSNLGN